MNKILVYSLFVWIVSSFAYGQETHLLSHPAMMFGDTTRTGVPFAKDLPGKQYERKKLVYFECPDRLERWKALPG